MLKENTALVADAKLKKLKKYAWLVLLSFGFMYLFFYNGRQNINLVMTQMAENLGSSTAALGVVSSALFWCYAFGQLINGRLGAFFWLQTVHDNRGYSKHCSQCGDFVSTQYPCYYCFMGA